MPLRKLGELRINSSPDQLTTVDQYTNQILRHVALPDPLRDDVAISVTEAVNNAIVHGNKSALQKRVSIKYYACSRYLRIVVEDQGGGFQLDQIPDPRLNDNLLKSSGRGILIMRHLMDRVAFQRARGGTKTILDKNCPEGCKLETDT